MSYLLDLVAAGDFMSLGRCGTRLRLQESRAKLSSDGKTVCSWDDNSVKHVQSLLVNMLGAISGGISVDAVRVRSCLCYHVPVRSFVCSRVRGQKIPPGGTGTVINIPGETKCPYRKGGISNVWWFCYLLGGQARGAEGTRMLTYAFPRPWGFPRTSGERKPIIINKIFIFIFLRLKVVLQAKPCKGGRCNLEGWSRLLRISQTQKTTYIRLQGAL